MTLLIALLLSIGSANPFSASPAASPVGARFAYATAQPPAATASTTQKSAPLVADADNHASLQAFTDSLPPGAVVTIPPGVWNTHKPIQLSRSITLQSTAAAATVIKGVFSAGQGHVAVIKAGNFGAGVPANGITLKKLTIEVSSLNTGGPVNCLFLYADKVLIEDCKLKGAPHEGVTAGATTGPVIRRCEAENCGKGNEYYKLTTAAFNCFAWKTRYEECKAVDCGQGYECGGKEVTAERCVAENCPGYGFNIGSNGSGVWKTRILNCTIRNCGTPLTVGNGIGRCRDNEIRGCVIDGGGTSNVMGGVEVNKHPDQPGTPTVPSGPGTSLVEDCVWICRSQPAGCIGYSTGPVNDTTRLYGRESYKFRRNVFYFIGKDQGTSPPTGFAGILTGDNELSGTRFFGLDAATLRGDCQVFWLYGTQTTLRHTDNRVFKADGSERPFVVKIEGAP